MPIIDLSKCPGCEQGEPQVILGGEVRHLQITGWNEQNTPRCTKPEKFLAARRSPEGGAK